MFGIETNRNSQLGSLLRRTSLWISSPHLPKPPQANLKYLETAAFFRDLFLISSSLNLCEQLTGKDFMMKEKPGAARCADLCCAQVIKCQHFYAFNQSSSPRFRLKQGSLAADGTIVAYRSVRHPGGG